MRGSASPRRSDPAADATPRSASVTPLIADTTTAGPRPSRVRAARTISISRRIAGGSATEVPPNFWTTMNRGLRAQGSGPRPQGWANGQDRGLDQSWGLRPEPWGLQLISAGNG